MDLTSCPACGLVAEVLWRDALESTDGPVEHARVRCAQRHCFLLPVASLALAEPVTATVTLARTPRSPAPAVRHAEERA